VQFSVSCELKSVTIIVIDTQVTERCVSTA